MQACVSRFSYRCRHCFLTSDIISGLRCARASARASERSTRQHSPSLRLIVFEAEVQLLD